MKDKLWLLFILITVVTWGVWGAFSGYQIQNGIPDTVVYILWALSMIPCAIVALVINKGKFLCDTKSILLGCTVGLLGAGGQLVLFKALTLGPSYIIYPFISMSPVIVITLAARQSGQRMALDRIGCPGALRMGYSGFLHEICQQQYGRRVDLRLDGDLRSGAHPRSMVYESGCRCVLCRADIGKHQSRMLRNPDPQLDRCADARICLPLR